MDNRSLVVETVSKLQCRCVYLAEVGRLDGVDFLLATDKPTKRALGELQHIIELHHAGQEQCDDAIRFTEGGYTIGIACRSSCWLTDMVVNCGERDHLIGLQSVWAPGYWLPESLYGDLAIAQICWGDERQLQRLRQLLNPYPEKLSQALVSLCDEEIERKQHVCRDDSLVGHLARRDCMIARIRWVFAVHHRYLRSLTGLGQQAAGLPEEGRRELAKICSRL